MTDREAFEACLSKVGWTYINGKEDAFLLWQAATLAERHRREKLTDMLLNAANETLERVIAERDALLKARKPLTDGAIRDAAKYAGLDWQRGYVVDNEHNRFADFARAIEAAHNIKGTT